MTAVSRRSLRTSWVRWLKFNAVGGVGIVVQLAALTVLASSLHLNYLWATALAVEMAVIHNFMWHERFTWADRVHVSMVESAVRLLKFNVTTGAVSILGSLLLMKFFVEVAHLHYLVANLGTIATCSLANFLVSDRFVFQGQ